MHSSHINGASCGTNAAASAAAPVFSPAEAEKDYVFAWWRDGFNRGSRRFFFRTGRYGMAYDYASGSLCRFGAVSPLTESEAQRSPNSDIDALTSFSCRMFAGTGGRLEPSCAMENIDIYGVHSRIIEMGHCTARIDSMYYLFDSLKQVKGRLELAAFARYARLTVNAFSPDAIKDFSMGISLDFACGAHILEENCVQMGDGTLLLLKGCTARTENGGIFLSGAPCTLEANSFNGGFSVILVPSSTARGELDALERIIISAINARTGEAVPTLSLPDGARIADTSALTPNLDFSVPENRSYYEKIHFTLENPTDTPVLLPVCFYKNDLSFPTSGLCPLLRLPDGEPCGLQVQLSKNWHRLHTDPSSLFYAPLHDPKRHLEGPWLHAWCGIPLAPGQKLTLEYNCLFASWGTVWSASHSQLCLAGWGGAYQLWESSAIGSFGEAFCYDAETSHGRAFIDDIRPLTVYTKNDVTQKQYQWTGCNGGGNFLMYFGPDGKQIPLVNIRVWFRSQGPNLTDVIYCGETADGAVSCTLRANLPRTDDCSRALHSFSYTFNKDVDFSRFVLYQLGADHYNDNDYPRICIGNNDGPAAFELCGVHYDGEFAPPLSDTPGYPGGSQQSIDIPGEGLFIACLGARMTNTNDCKFGPVANRTLILRSFDADINGRHFAKPGVSLYRTVDFGVSCLACELCLPKGITRVRAGSRISGTAEYLNLPLKKEYYYGPSAVMRSFDEKFFDSWRLAHAYALSGQISARVASGKLLCSHPLTVQCLGDTAELTLSGGLSYAPVTFTGLSVPYGFTLLVNRGSGWEALDQSLEGSDFRQCHASGDGWELTFNVELTGGICRLKLVHAKQ